MKESIFPSPDDILCHVGPAQSLQLRDNIPTGNNRSSSCSSRSRLLSTRSLLILLLRFDLFLLNVFSGGLILLLTLFFQTLSAQENTLLRITSGQVKFTSEAPLELIEAQSDKLNGILDLNSENFAFSILIKSFEGFNSPLQKEHFNENYMESDRFKEATFEGRIIDDIDINEPGEKDVQIKGKFKIHGVEQSQIMTVHLTIEEGRLLAEGSFDIRLDDYAISIPKIVNKKIAEVIKVDVNVVFEKDQ